MPYLLIINQMSKPFIDNPEWFNTLEGFEGITPLIISMKGHKYKGHGLHIIDCDLTSPAAIAEAIAPYTKDIAGVFCAGETNIQYLQHTIPALPSHIKVASIQALADSTNKRAMREAFSKHFPEITPRFVQVRGADEQTVTELESEVQYPVIIKPASLASSMLIRVCHDRNELTVGLRETFAVISDIYKHENRETSPEVIVEEYLEGDLYSVDVYTTTLGTSYFCPPVYYLANKQRGWDDFSLYKRVIPTQLTDRQITEANETARKAIQAVGLTYSSAHVELILTTNGWKIIELGPRIGRYRHRMYMRAYGINHYLNDVRIHLGLEPVIPQKLLKYCAAYSIYPEKEGVLREVAGLDYLKHNPAIVDCDVRTKLGEVCKFAKNGGKIVVEFYVVSEDKQTFDEAVAYVEEHVKAITD